LPRDPAPANLDHMWFGGGFSHFLKPRLRIYVDGEETPSIDMELGLGVAFTRSRDALAAAMPCQIRTPTTAAAPTARRIRERGTRRAKERDPNPEDAPIHHAKYRTNMVAI
jgi:hypothetical protein